MLRRKWEVEFLGRPAIKDLSLSLLWFRFDSLAQELPHAVGAAKKKKKKKKRKKKWRVMLLVRTWSSKSVFQISFSEEEKLSQDQNNRMEENHAKIQS